MAQATHHALENEAAELDRVKGISVLLVANWNLSDESVASVLRVGAAVVGLKVGLAVGMLDAVGEKVGASVGVAVGACVGAFEGAAVGASQLT